MWNFVITMCLLTGTGPEAKLECNDYVMDYSITHEDCFAKFADFEMHGHIRAVGCELIQD